MGLEELLAQKKQIEEQIRKLRGAEFQVGNAKIQRSINYKNTWQLSIGKKYFDDTAPARRIKNVWMGVADSRERETVVNYIPTLISDLQKLYEKCTEVEN